MESWRERRSKRVSWVGGTESRSDLERASWVSMSFLGSVQVSMSWLTRRMMRRLSSEGVGRGSSSGVSDISGVAAEGVKAVGSGRLPDERGWFVGRGWLEFSAGRDADRRDAAGGGTGVE